MKLIITTLIFVIYSTHASAIPVKIKTTKSDQNIARTFVNLYDQSLKNKFDLTQTRFLYRKMKKRSLFGPYIPWSKNLVGILSQKNPKKLYNKCLAIQREFHENHITKVLTQKNLQTCFQKFIDLSYSKEKVPFTKEAIERIDHIYSIYVQSNSVSQLYRPLRNIKSNKRRFKEASKSLEVFITRNEIIPPARLLAHMQLTPDFSRYVQTGKVYTNKDTRVFIREIRFRADSILSLIDEKKEYKSDLKELNKFINDHQSKISRASLDKRLLSFGKSLSRRKQYPQARRIFSMISKNSDLHQDKLFEMMWTFGEEKDYDDAVDYIQENLAYKDILKNSQLAFWYAQYLDMDGDKKDAMKVLKDIIPENPLSFYSVVASNIIQEKQKDKKDTTYWKHAKTDKLKLDPLKEKAYRNSLKRISLWSKYPLLNLVYLEINSIKHEKLEVAPAIYASSKFLNKNKRYLDAFKILYKHIEDKDIQFTPEVLKLLFPRPYLKLVKKNVSDFDPLIALSLIRQESGFNKTARSPAGAKGLMQLMPATARRFKKRLKKKHLYNPRLNISIGSRFFQKLLTKYDNNLIYSLAAYNAGQRKVDAWQEEFLDGETLIHNIEKIPYNETRKYVKLIFRNLFFYKLLNEGDSTKEELDKIFDNYLGFNSFIESTYSRI